MARLAWTIAGPLSVPGAMAKPRVQRNCAAGACRSVGRQDAAVTLGPLAASRTVVFIPLRMGAWPTA